MRHFQSPTYRDATLEDVLPIAEQMRRDGSMFVAITATTCAGGVELLYVYRSYKRGSELAGATVLVKPGQRVPSITRFYPEAFVFENEAHDLFDVSFDGLVPDYQGEFYQIASEHPMNPGSSDGGASGSARPGAKGGCHE